MSEVILFDLDGTLTDSAEGITKSVQYALKYFGIEEPDLKKLECFVGPPLKEQFMKYCRFSEKQAEIAVSVYRERYAQTGIYENRPYDGIESVLRLLKTRGKILGVASSKPTVYVNRILEHFNLTQYFDVIAGAEMDGTRTDKAEVIEYALEQLNMQDKRSDVLMVGDRRHDVEGAQACGLQCIGVAYGYGGIYELETAGAVYIAQTVEDLKILAGRGRGESTAPRSRPATQSNPFQKIWRIIYPIGIHYGISVIVSVVAALIIRAWYGIYQGMGVNTVVTYQQRYTLIITGISSVLTIPLLLWFYKKDCMKRGQKKRSVGAGTYIATALFMMCLSQLANDLISLSNLSELFPYYSELEEKVFSNQPLIITFLVVVLLAPLTEELLFRGLVFKRLQDYIGTGLGIVVSALLFGAFHQNMVQFVYAGVIGLAFAALMSRTGTLKIPIVGHMAANLWSVLGPSLLKLIIGENTVIYWITKVVMAIICVAMFMMIWARNSAGRLRGGYINESE